LWALDTATGNLIWKSDVVARVNGCPGPLHERITYSSPLVFSGRVFVGVHDAADNPVQKGKIIAVDLNSGNLAPGFSFVAAGAPGDPTCGGVCGAGVWDSPATDGKSVIFTTGNVCDWNKYKTAECEPEPSPDYSLSMVGIDPTTGARTWSFRAVPFKLDSDPDWSAGPTSMLTSCGQLIGSVQKDGWAYAVNPADGSCKWQFPPTAGAGCVFSPSDTHTHGDDDYKQPGASWGDYLFIQSGGEALPTDGVGAGYGRLHALDACQGDNNRVRWIADIAPGQSYSIGAPVVTGGMVYVTTSTGHVVALADPSVAAPSGFRCTSIDFGPPSPTWASDCITAGYSIVPVPASKDVALGDNGDAVGLRMEAAIALDQLYVATSQGHIYALSP
jgi:outer membrane protein assembly factor BamB